MNSLFLKLVKNSKKMSPSHSLLQSFYLILHVLQGSQSLKQSAVKFS